ncbi:hypothetical protein [Spongiactinospora gelatinilytica]|uniref:hypothetical protein n=1 Tax=Spongiactinospora gelatinilytica TaxID=2666298 RepID=UPI001F29F9CC|nr:hypothetical protein [Spongiactinospora gelatinilytica]
MQVLTGVGIAWHKGLTWASLAEPGYGRDSGDQAGAVLCGDGGGGATRLGGGRGASAYGAVASLIGSLGVVLLATALPAT